MELVIKNIYINSFKGVESFEADLQNENKFVGTNKTGKTTIANAFTWCLFGKDIYDRANYQIMPLDADGEMIDHKEPTVILTLSIDGNKKVFKRVMTQKWVKKRGTSESNFDGSCTTSYFVDDVPVKQKEYNDIVNSIIEENLFRIIILPTHFPSLDWKIKREVITSIIGDADIDGIKARSEFAKLTQTMDGKSIEDFRKMIAHQKKELKKDIDRIPASIQAAQEFIPETEPNYVDIQAEIDSMESDIKVIDKKISDKTSVLDDFQASIQKRASDIAKLEHDKIAFIESFIADKQKELDAVNDEKLVNQQAISAKKAEINQVSSDLKDSENFLNTLNTRLSTLEAKRSTNKQSYTELKAKAFVAPVDKKCMSCGQDIIATPEQIEELMSTFNVTKSNELQAILDSNKPLMEECKDIEDVQIPASKKYIQTYDHNLSVLKKDLEDLEAISAKFISRIAAVNLSAARQKAKEHSEYIAFDKSIEYLKSLSNQGPKVDVSEFNKEKSELRSKIEDLQKVLNKKDTIDQAKQNIAKYKANGKEMSKILAELEGLEYSTELLEKAIAEDVENRINSQLTNGVTFKMFHKQNNEGIKPTCEILVNGVPYHSANTASQIMSGIVIINLLSNHYNTYAPIIIDNRESVVEIPETKSQTINLVVDESIKTLTLK